MAEANRKTTFDSPANREDLADIVYNVDPWETPFLTNIGTTTATNVLHQWPVDTLKAFNVNNATLEGDDATIEQVVNPTRETNYVQYLSKTGMVTDVQQATRQAGVDDELDYQIVKSTKEIRTDLEGSLLSNNIKGAGDKSTTAPTMAGVQTWIGTNFVSATDGVAPVGADGTAGRTAGATTSDFIEEDLKKALRSAWTNGGLIDCALMPPAQKEKMSAFAGNASREIGAQDRELVATIDVYNGDFDMGIEVKADRFMTNAAGTQATPEPDYVLLAQMDMWALSELESLYYTPLARTGTAEKFQLNWFATLEARNEKASACVADTA